MMTVNELLPSRITRLDATRIIPKDFHGKEPRDWKIALQCILEIIDDLGVESTKAQGLSKILTSGDHICKTRNVIYILKKTEAKMGKGDLVGLLKVGPKHLYLINNHNQMVDNDITCVLDFYVRREYQRQGCGKELYEFMLKDQNILPTKLAIDGPSNMFRAFLKKHYDPNSLIRQYNNFYIHSAFFEDPLKRGSTDSCCSKQTLQMQQTLMTKCTSLRPRSSIASIIHGDNDKHRPMVNKRYM